MLISKLVVKQLLAISLFILFMPSIIKNSQATLALEIPPSPDVPRTWPEISLQYSNIYHNTTTLWQEISYLNLIAPQLVDVEIIGHSYFNKDIKVICVTNELLTCQKAKTLVVAHHHGRELISLESTLSFLIYLLNGYGIDTQITDYINTQEIYIIPTINPDALDAVVNDNNYRLRKNMRPFDDDSDGFLDEDPLDDIDGDNIINLYTVYEKIEDSWVYLSDYYEGIDNDGDGLINEDYVGYIDLNRNYPTFFRNGTGWTDDPFYPNYPGTTPFSEPEIQAYRDFAVNHKFAMAYSLHSGLNATILPKSSLGYFEPVLYETMGVELNNLLPPSFLLNSPYSSLSIQAETVYAAGVWDNWMYFERGTLVPISLELYENLSANYYNAQILVSENSTHLITEWKEIKNYYNPDENSLDNHCLDILPIYPYLLQNTPRLSVIANLYSIVDRPGSLVNISFTCKNLSPNIRTIFPVEIFNYDGEKIFEEGTEILANSTVQIDSTIPLPFTFNETYYIKIGNEYTGYYPFILKIIEPSTTTAINLPIIGVCFITLILYRLDHLIHKKRK